MAIYSTVSQFLVSRELYSILYIHVPDGQAFSVLLSLRTWAIYGKQKKVVMILGPLGISSVVSSGVSDVYFVFTELAPIIFSSQYHTFMEYFWISTPVEI